MSIRQLPTIAYIRQCLRYENGKLFWLHRPRELFATSCAFGNWNTKYSGTEAGYRHKRDGGDRWLVSIGGRLLRRSRIVWAMHNGDWPKLIDHDNRNTLDDRIENLRPATGTQNNGNAGIHIDNKSGYKGISWSNRGKKWVASIKSNGKWKYLGSFTDPEQAHAAYVAASKEHFGDFACSG